MIYYAKIIEPKNLVIQYFKQYSSELSTTSGCSLVVRIPRCGRGDLGSNPSSHRYYLLCPFQSFETTAFHRLSHISRSRLRSTTESTIVLKSCLSIPNSDPQFTSIFYCSIVAQGS